MEVLCQLNDWPARSLVKGDLVKHKTAPTWEWHGAHFVMPAFSKKGAAWRPPDRDRNINVLLIRAYFLAPILGLLTFRTVLANIFSRILAQFAAVYAWWNFPDSLCFPAKTIPRSNLDEAAAPHSPNKNNESNTL